MIVLAVYVCIVAVLLVGARWGEDLDEIASRLLRESRR